MENKKVEVVAVGSPATGTWSRDCELLGCKLDPTKDIELMVYKDSDQSKWRIVFRGVTAFSWYTEENPARGDLRYSHGELPHEGFLEVKNSPWLLESDPDGKSVIAGQRHFIYSCYDDIFEFMADGFEIFPCSET
jgi:hypothetical protein